MRIGIDLDNTIINYERAFERAAAGLGMFDVAGIGKTGVRDRIRLLDDGEMHWQRVQAHVYGPAIGTAEPYAGVAEFFAAARARGAQLAIVSHKSEFAAAAPDGTNLRDAATVWLAERGIVRAGDPPVFFESTRAAKCERIASLELDVFIDDLTEVFFDAAYPRRVARWLFAPAGASAEEAAHADRVFASWDALRAAAFS